MLLRRYILYIIIGVGLVACNKQSHPIAPETVEQAIGMAPTSVAATRALIADTKELQREGFIVYGYKERPSDAEQVFAHQAVNYTIGWTYSPTRYWDQAATYYFGAFSPQGVDVDHQGTGKAPHAVLIETPYWQVIDGSETDIIVATSHDAGNNYMVQQGGYVDLAFEHILSQLEVQFAHSPFLMNEYRLHSVSYKNVPVANSTATYTLNYTTPENSAMGAVTMTTGDNAVAIANSEGGIVVKPEGDKDPVAFKHLVVPFTTSATGGIGVVVDYSVSGVRREITVPTQLQTLEAGKRYVLTLLFNSGAEIVPTIYINEWIDEEIDENDKYNW